MMSPTVLGVVLVPIVSCVHATQTTTESPAESAAIAGESCVPVVLAFTGMSGEPGRREAR